LPCAAKPALEQAVHESRDWRRPPDSLPCPTWPSRSPRCSRSCASPGCAPLWPWGRDAARADGPAVPRHGRLPPAALAGALRRGDARRPGSAPAALLRSSRATSQTSSHLSPPATAPCWASPP